MRDIKPSPRFYFQLQPELGKYCFCGRELVSDYSHPGPGCLLITSTMLWCENDRSLTHPLHNTRSKGVTVKDAKAAQVGAIVSRASLSCLCRDDCNLFVACFFFFKQGWDVSHNLELVPCATPSGLQRGGSEQPCVAEGGRIYIYTL